MLVTKNETPGSNGQDEVFPSGVWASEGTSEQSSSFSVSPLLLHFFQPFVWSPIIFISVFSCWGFWLLLVPSESLRWVGNYSCCWPAPAWPSARHACDIGLSRSKWEESGGRWGVDGRVGSASVEKREEKLRERREKGREGSGLWWWTGNLQGHEFFSRLHPQGYKDSYRCKEAGCHRHLFSTGTRVSTPPPPSLPSSLNFRPHPPYLP